MIIVTHGIPNIKQLKIVCVILDILIIWYG